VLEQRWCFCTGSTEIRTEKKLRMTNRMETRNRAVIPSELVRLELAPFPMSLSDPIMDQNGGSEELEPAEADEDNDGTSKMKPRNSKKTVDVKWTDTMEKKLISAVYMHKAYKKSSKTMLEKFNAIKADLLANKEFDGFRDKSWETLKSKWGTIMKNFKAKYAFEGEGANLSCFDPSKPDLFVGHEKILFDCCFEIANLEADKQELRKKQKETNKAMLTHEGESFEQTSCIVSQFFLAGAILRRQSVMSSSSSRPTATPGPSTVQIDSTEEDAPSSGAKSDDVSHLSEGSARSTKESHSVKSVMEKFLTEKTFNLTGSPTKEELEVKLEEEKRKTIEANNDGLKLQLALKALEATEKMSTVMGRIGPAMEKMCSRMDQFMARGEKRGRERDDDGDGEGDWVLKTMRYERQSSMITGSRFGRAAGPSASHSSNLGGLRWKY